jgi:hypothetical protein
MCIEVKHGDNTSRWPSAAPTSTHASTQAPHDVVRLCKAKDVAVLLHCHEHKHTAAARLQQLHQNCMLPDIAPYTELNVHCKVCDASAATTPNAQTFAQTHRCELGWRQQQQLQQQQQSFLGKTKCQLALCSICSAIDVYHSISQHSSPQPCGTPARAAVQLAALPMDWRV